MRAYKSCDFAHRPRPNYSASLCYVFLASAYFVYFYEGVTGSEGFGMGQGSSEKKLQTRCRTTAHLQKVRHSFVLISVRLYAAL